MHFIVTALHTPSNHAVQHDEKVNWGLGGGSTHLSSNPSMLRPSLALVTSLLIFPLGSINFSQHLGIQVVRYVQFLSCQIIIAENVEKDKKTTICVAVSTEC